MLHGATSASANISVLQKKTGCFEIKAALYAQIHGNCDGGDAASQARIESRERALMHDPGLRKKIETSVGVTPANLIIRQLKAARFS